MHGVRWTQSFEVPHPFPIYMHGYILSRERERERMVNTIKLYMSLLRATMKLAGVKPLLVEIEPGTVMNFWVPKQTKNKPPVVLLHGLVGDGILTWQFQVLSLAKKYAVYVPDLLFFGGSTTRATHRSINFQAECVAKGLAKLGVERQCAVVGFLYGGLVGFKLAELYPELVSLLVVTGALPALTESISKECLEKIGSLSWSEFLLPSSASGVKKMFQIGSHRFGKLRLPQRLFYDALKVMFEHRKERAELLEAFTIPDQDFMLPAFSQSLRVHLLWGEHDPIIGVELAKTLGEQLGDQATLECIDKAGHIVPLERPCAYTKGLTKILAMAVAHSN